MTAEDIRSLIVATGEAVSGIIFTWWLCRYAFQMMGGEEHINVVNTVEHRSEEDE